jgi:hypothetical protein
MIEGKEFKYGQEAHRAVAIRERSSAASSLTYICLGKLLATPGTIAMMSNTPSCPQAQEDGRLTSGAAVDVGTT